MKLQEARIRKRLTLRDLAQKSGFLERSLENLEQGTWVPSLPTMRKLSEILGVEPTEIDEFKEAIEKAEKRPKR